MAGVSTPRESPSELKAVAAGEWPVPGWSQYARGYGARDQETNRAGRDVPLRIGVTVDVARGRGEDRRRHPGWDKYTCTSANEFALDVQMAWVRIHPEHDARDAYAAIMSGVPVERESVSGDSPTCCITYGLTSFARVLQCIEAIRGGGFDPHVPGGIIGNDEA
ncbi:hypothetical protein [Streptomyces sp. NBC_00102]|uniref:hypothetical protein n=1 Tax=Streptomyces sp. NBC_00102 TaxID=2975652 RepID=UPI00225507A6|nr:hypothetical protein [Streptomyces sp. NBC_00102]MCX5401424.1 hypothetical protein [Streptomyces sp. NBC_00102]